MASYRSCRQSDHCLRTSNFAPASIRRMEHACSVLSKGVLAARCPRNCWQHHNLLCFTAVNAAHGAVAAIFVEVFGVML